MIGATVGYARTSTVEQDAGLQAQLDELRAAGCDRVFAEQVSSVDVERPKLQEALAFLRDGDTFVVARPDRLARSTRDLLDIVDGLTARGVAVKILSMDLNTGNATGRLILTILAGIAEFERSLMLERQRHGIAKAKAEGKYRGRAPTARARSTEVWTLKFEGYGVGQIVRRTGISRASVYRILSKNRIPAKGVA
ncbi:recombinase family protein [Terricaulis sp.]|uniref:recombinase family protein n=1 Tax=Terricaulis sp. TaxID=2768686 RepID=UPI002AC4E6D0|nr:recombinase family protein [Terricaulis sp.]MDZ4689696.1 recombinase family protein [Terricaulis sp.]